MRLWLEEHFLRDGSMRGILILAAIVALACPRLSRTNEVDQDADSASQFEKHIRPVLATQCLKCHGEDKQEGNLRLDTLDAMLEGGDSGPAVVQGKPEESLVIEALSTRASRCPRPVSYRKRTSNNSKLGSLTVPCGQPRRDSFARRLGKSTIRIATGGPFDRSQIPTFRQWWKMTGRSIRSIDSFSTAYRRNSRCVRLRGRTKPSSCDDSTSI